MSMEPNRVVLISALFLAAFANFAFFRNVHASFGGAPWSSLHIASLGLVLFCVLLILLTLLTPRPLLKPVLAFMFVLSSVTAYFMDTYNLIIDSDMLNNAVATHAEEAADLLTLRLLIYLVLIGILPSALLLKLNVKYGRFRAAAWSRLRTLGVATISLFALILVSSAFYASFVREHKSLRYYANPLTPLHAVYEYGKRHSPGAPVELQLIGEDAHIPPTDHTRELVVLVVGETARADRFSLNGYGRKTNPELEQRGVISFTRVSACGTSTEISVPCMFSVYDRSEYSEDRAKNTENLLDVLDHAGIHVLWRDNNSNSKGVADRLLNENFRNENINPVCDAECRDEGMLTGLQHYIDQQADGDVLVVLHQMGSHGPAYYKRYPPEFRAFKPTCDTNQLDSCSDVEIGNTYDNTILYTDYFLSRVIDLLAANDERFETAMMYVSDHGESLGESGVYLHGLPYFIAPEEQTAIPVIMWFGRNFWEADPAAVEAIKDKPFSHDSVFHTVLGLFELQTRVYQEDKDLLAIARKAAGGARLWTSMQANRTPGN